MAGIVNHFKLVFAGYAVDFLDVADVPVDVYGHYGTCPVSDEAFELAGVNGEILRVYVAENWCQAVADDGVSCGCKRERSGDDFALKVHSLKSQL